MVARKTSTVSKSKTVAKPAAKKTPTKKKAESDPTADVAAQIIDAVVNGDLDGHLSAFDDAVTERLNRMVAEEEKANRAKTRPSASGVKKPAPGPKKSSAPVSVKPVKDTEYVVSASFKKLAGATVTFLRHKDADPAKSVVMMMTDKPGNPKGKRVVVPTNALTEEPAAAKSTKRKVAAKKK